MACPLLTEAKAVVTVHAKGDVGGVLDGDRDHHLTNGPVVLGAGNGSLGRGSAVVPLVSSMAIRLSCSHHHCSWRWGS